MVARNTIRLIDGAEQLPRSDTGGFHPNVNQPFGPIGNRNCTPHGVFPYQVKNYPSFFSQLEFLKAQPCGLLASQARSDQESENGLVAFAFQSFTCGSV